MQPIKINLLKTDVHIKETYSEEQLKILLKKPDTKKCSFAEYRNWTMINFFLATAVR